MENDEPGGTVEDDSMTVESNLELVTFIQLTRLYDVGLAILQEINPEKASTIHTLHTRGDFISAPPALAPTEGE
jgi:hypothetical protein